MEANDDFEILEKYINKNLTLDEIHLIEKKLSDDENFYKKLKFLQEVQASFKIKRAKSLINELDQFEKTLDKNKIRKGKHTITVLFALVILVLCSSIYYYSSYSKQNSIKTKVENQKMDNNDNTLKDSIIADQENPQLQNNKDDQSLRDKIKNLVEFPSKPQFADNTLRSVEDDTSYFATSLILFKNKQYKDCLLSIGDNNQSMDKYVKAHCYYNLRQFEKAELIFEELSKSSFFLNNEDALWYLAQSCIMQYPNKVKKANAILLNIKNDPNNPYYDNAIILDKKLNKH